MPLSEQRRSQLDGIVQKMVQNKESDSNIQFVVDDFKKKYEAETANQPVQAPSNQPIKEGVLAKIGNFIAPASKSISQAIIPKTQAYQDLQASKERGSAQDQQIMQMINEARKSGNMEKVKKLSKILKISPDAQPSLEDVATNNEGFKTPTQIAGDFAQTGLNIVSGGSLTGGSGIGLVNKAGQAAKLGKYNLATNVGGKAGSTLDKVADLTKVVRGFLGGQTGNWAAKTAGRIAGSAATGAGMGSAVAASNDEDILRGAAQGAAGGAIAQGALSAASGIVNAGKKVLGAAGKEVYGQLVNTPIRQTLAGKENISEGLMKRGVTGSYDKMIQKVENELTKNKTAIAKVITENGGEAVDLVPTVHELQKLKLALAATPGESVSAVDNVLDDIYKLSPGLKEGAKTSISLTDAQELKQRLQKAVNTAFLSKNSTGTTEAQKVAARSIMKSIEEKVPTIKDPNKAVEFLIRAKDQLIKKSEASPSKLRIFAEIGLGAYGAKDSLETGNVSPLLAIILGERAITNPAIASRIGQTAYKLSKTELNKALSAFIAKQAALRAAELNQQE